MNLRQLLAGAEIFVDRAEADARRRLGATGWSLHGAWVREYLTAMRRTAVDVLDCAA